MTNSKIIPTPYNIAIATLSGNRVSETFIQAHISLLTGTIHAFHGSPIPIHSDESAPNFKEISQWKKILPAFIYERLRWHKENPHNILESLYRYHNINIVLAEYGHSGCAVLPVCKKLAIPMIVHFHGHDAFRHAIIDKFGKGYSQMFEYASYIISVSKTMTAQLQKLGAPPEKIVYNPYGPRDDFFKLQPDYANGFFLAVGRFVEKKAPYLTLLAFNRMQRRFPDAELVMIGDGPLLPVCVNLVNSLQIKNVTFKGALPHNEVLSIYEKSFCIVQHSIVASDGDSEGTPLAILEAGAAGLPVVSTVHSGIPDTVIHSRTGFLVQEGDIEQMSEYMSQIYSNKELRVNMGNEARKHIAENFSITNHISTINKLICQVLDPDNNKV